jgi:hypothetical protein
MPNEVPKDLIDAVKNSLKSATLSKVEKTSEGYELTFRGLKAGRLSIDNVFAEISPAIDGTRHEADEVPIVLRFVYIA